MQFADLQLEVDPATEEYRAQIRECARNLAIARNDGVRLYLPPGMTVEKVKMFTDGNLDKRYGKLGDQLEEFAEAFPDLEDWIVEYVKAVPLAAYDTGSSDTGHFMAWVERNKKLTPEQRDCFACQRARLAVEELGDQKRPEHGRFQELLSLVEVLSAELETNFEMQIHANPVHAFAELTTTFLLDEDDELPATAVFFPVGNDIRTAVLEPEGEAVFRELIAEGPCNIDQLAFGVPGIDRADAVELCRELAETGLAAFG